MTNFYSIIKKILNESVNQNNVESVINNKQRVLIKYRDEESHAVGQRLIEPYVLGLSKAGNLVLRAFQYNGSTLRGIPKWKMFRLDRIISWKPLKTHFELSPSDQGWNAPDYNANGDKSMASVIVSVNFGKNDKLYQPSLEKAKKRTKMAQNGTNAISTSKLETMPTGPIRQRKKNIYTSQPKSDKYKQYQNNLAQSERDSREKNNYWNDYDKAEKELKQKKDSEMDNYNGPIDSDDEYNDYYDTDYDDDFLDYMKK